MLDYLVAMLGTIAQHVEDYVAQHAALQPLSHLTTEAARTKASPTTAAVTPKGSSPVLAAPAPEITAPLAMMRATVPGSSCVARMSVPGTKPVLRPGRVTRSRSMLLYIVFHCYPP